MSLNQHEVVKGATVKTETDMANKDESDGLIDDWDEGLERVLHFETIASERGLNEGRRVRIEKDAREGWHFGAAKGVEIGAEVGFYAGVADARLALLADQLGYSTPQGSTRGAERIRRALETLKALADNFPEENVRDTSAADQLQEARGKFRLCCALLGIKDGGSAFSPSGISW